MEYEKNSIGHLLTTQDLTHFVTEGGYLRLPVIKKAKHRRMELLQTIFETIEHVSGGSYSYLNGIPADEAEAFARDQLNRLVGLYEINSETRDNALFFSSGATKATVALSVPADRRNQFFTATVINHQYVPNVCHFKNGVQTHMRRLPLVGT